MDKKEFLKNLREILEASKVDLSKKGKKRKEFIGQIIEIANTFANSKPKPKKNIKGVYVYTPADSARSDEMLGRGPR